MAPVLTATAACTTCSLGNTGLVLPLHLSQCLCVPERDYLCLISSLAALYSLLLRSSSLEIFIGKALTAQTFFLQGGLLYRLLQACLLRKFSY